MAKIVISTTEKLKEDWFDFCKSRNTKATPMLLMMIKRVLGDDFIAEKKEPEKAKKLQINIRLNERYKSLMTERANTEGFPSRQSWATNLLLSTLKKEPVLTDEEIKELRLSNRQLASIGRNINQIAKALNMEKDIDQQVNETILNNIHSDINEHKKLVSALIHRSLNRWVTNS